MRNHFKYFQSRFFLGVYGPHPAKALLPQDIPIPDVLRRVQVCIFRVATGHTSKPQTITILPSNMAASWASLRRISWIHDLRPNAFLGKLIARLELQRRIGPSTDFLPKVLFLLQGSLSDIAKVFEHDHSSIRLFSVLGQGFRSNMQEMFRNGPFAVRQSPQKAMARPGTYGLNRRPYES